MKPTNDTSYAAAMTFRIAFVAAAALAALFPLATPAAAALRPAGVTVDATFAETFLYSRGPSRASSTPRAAPTSCWTRPAARPA